jgi:hypothetical protein
LATPSFWIRKSGQFDGVIDFDVLTRAGRAPAEEPGRRRFAIAPRSNAV